MGDCVKMWQGCGCSGQKFTISLNPIISIQARHLCHVHRCSLDKADSSLPAHRNDFFMLQYVTHALPRRHEILEAVSRVESVREG